MKHAFLIIAHADYEVLRVLVDMLDNKCCDIYIMIDKKAPLPTQLHVKYARLFMLKKRIDIRWGHVSLIKAEMQLFEIASANGSYEYYHLLSGNDLLIKPLNYVFDFFDQNRGKEFVGFTSGTHWLEKVMKYQFFIKYYRLDGMWGNLIKSIAYRLEYIANRINKRSDESFRKGSEWVSITDDFCRYLIGEKNGFLNVFGIPFVEMRYSSKLYCGTRHIRKISIH